MTMSVGDVAAALSDRYRIERELGAGGMATVYLAHDLKHDRRVAVKVLHPDLAATLGAERFLAEIKTTANLQHPHILPLHDSGVADGFLFYVMPFVEGESLRERLNREKQLPIDDAIELSQQVASALDYAHRHHVVHRDIKPENLLLHEGSALVADFGIALAGAPKFLPGSKAVLIATCEKNPAAVGVCVGELHALDIATRKSKRLLENVRRGWYVPGGYLVFGTQEGALYGVRFDVAKLAIAGTPVALLGVINTGRAANVVRVSVAAQSGTMAYLSGASSDDGVLVQVDRTGHEQVIVTTPAPYNAPRLSPDARRIVLQMRDAKGSPQVWIHDRVSATTVQLTFDGQNIRPDWSPDGNRVAFSTNRIAGKNYIWSMPADGSNKGERVGSGPEIDANAPVSWTRDGKWIVIDGVPEDGRGAGGEDVFAIPTTGTARAMRSAVATSSNDQVGTVSPDGKWIAFVSDNAGRYQVYVQPFLSPGGRTLVSAGAAAEPAWASNDELMFVNTDADSMVVARLQFGPTTSVKRTTLFDHRPFLSAGPSSRGYDVSRDGKSLVFVRPILQRTAVEPIIVLNWQEEVRRLIDASGAKR